MCFLLMLQQPSDWSVHVLLSVEKKKKRERIREEEKKKRFAVGGPLAIFSFLSNFQRLLIKTQKKSKQAENSRSSIMKIHSYE